MAGVRLVVGDDAAFEFQINALNGRAAVVHRQVDEDFSLDGVGVGTGEHFAVGEIPFAGTFDHVAVGDVHAQFQRAAVLRMPCLNAEGAAAVHHFVDVLFDAVEFARIHHRSGYDHVGVFLYRHAFEIREALRGKERQQPGFSHANALVGFISPHHGHGSFFRLPCGECGILRAKNFDVLGHRFVPQFLPGRYAYDLLDRPMPRDGGAPDLSAVIVRRDDIHIGDAALGENLVLQHRHQRPGDMLALDHDDVVLLHSSQ